jgi:hypothetical protein
MTFSQLDTVLKLVELLLENGWVIVLGKYDYAVQYYRDVCSKLSPFDCLTIDVSSGGLGFDISLMFIRKSEKFKTLINISDKDFENLFMVEVTLREDGGELKNFIIFTLYPNKVSAINNLLEMLGKSIMFAIDRAKIWATAMNLPLM